jgi:hypothetical protein
MSDLNARQHPSLDFFSPRGLRHGQSSGPRPRPAGNTTSAEVGLLRAPVHGSVSVSHVQDRVSVCWHPSGFDPPSVEVKHPFRESVSGVSQSVKHARSGDREVDGISACCQLAALYWATSSPVRSRPDRCPVGRRIQLPSGVVYVVECIARGRGHQVLSYAVRRGLVRIFMLADILALTAKCRACAHRCAK